MSLRRLPSHAYQNNILWPTLFFSQNQNKLKRTFSLSTVKTFYTCTLLHSFLSVLKTFVDPVCIPLALIYSSIIKYKIPPIRPYQIQWKTELGITVESEYWQIMSQAIANSSVLILENAYQILHQWYYTPNYSITCGCYQAGSMAYIWWTCPLVSQLWIWVYNLIRTSLHSNVHKIHMNLYFNLNLLLTFFTQPMLTALILTAIKL